MGEKAELHISSFSELQGSLKELETNLLIAQRVGITSHQATEPLMNRSESVGTLLRPLVRKLSPE